MSSGNLNKEFVDFGNRIYVIAILTLLNFILSIVGIFVPLVGFVALIFSLIIIIYFLLVLGNANRAGQILSNQDLLNFRPRFLWGTIIRFGGQVLISFSTWGDLTTFLIMLLIGIALIIIGSILRYMAWSGLQVFFETNTQLFPQNISIDGSKGSKYCKYATILDMTIILSIIGEILRIFGYFKLASTKNLAGTSAQPAYQPTVSQPAPTPAAPVTTTASNFCPNCGSPTVSGAKYCPNCGSDLS
ncbi:MAG: zinc-ribbon domain-containing protein [Promethearchaeota archaeon]|nr:MAG: zinc-ribbon domain-containing protein [Candidatus Lokiarchaeota archaeon]